MEKLENIFNKIKENNKLGHAFLIGNTTYEDIAPQIEKVIASSIFLSNIKIENNPSIIIINPENGIISKEAIEDLQLRIKNKSQISKNKIYIICECEKMNLFSANSLLKMLEDPEENVYAFLITSNISSVLETIRSRCELILLNTDFISSKAIEEFSEEEKKVIVEFIKSIEHYKKTIIAYNDKIKIKNLTKKDLKKTLIMIQFFYIDCLKFALGNEPQIFKDNLDFIKTVIESTTLINLSKKILIINESIKSIEYNLNLSMIFDGLMIKLNE